MNIFYKFLSVFAVTFSIVLPTSSYAGDVVNVTVGLHQAEVVNLPRAMSRVIIADRKVGGVVKLAPTKVSVIGHDIGKTNIRIMNGNRIVRQINLIVTQDANGIKRVLKTLFPNEKIGVEMINETVALTGFISSLEAAAQATKVVEEYVSKNSEGESKVINLMKINSGQQVMLKVRVGEVARDTIDKMGLGVNGILSGDSPIIGALQSREAFKVLAEPTLTAISGETAEFLAGGEFPIPVANNKDSFGVVYKSFGVSVDFTPVVLSENRIRLDVESEVSELAGDNSLSTSTLNVPAISTRRANTTVELAPGESFMIAGLIRNDSIARLSKVPGLGEIPVLSALFSSSKFKNNETELVIAVTPYLVDPVEAKDIRLPTDNARVVSPIELFFLGGFANKQDTGLEGPVGFLTD